jgi:hypothetical protein
MAPTPTDLLTGISSSAGETVRPEHIFRALLQNVGIDDDIADYGVEGLSALFG